MEYISYKKALNLSKGKNFLIFRDEQFFICGDTLFHLNKERIVSIDLKNGKHKVCFFSEV